MVHVLIQRLKEKLFNIVTWKTQPTIQAFKFQWFPHELSHMNAIFTFFQKHDNVERGYECGFSSVFLSLL